MAGTIETSCANGIFRIVINDPERLNAMTPALADTVHAQLLRAQAEARVVVLGGAGKAFCAGANLADVMSDPDNLADGGSVLEHHYKRSEEQTSALQSLMRISYAVFCLKQTNNA